MRISHLIIVAIMTIGIQGCMTKPANVASATTETSPTKSSKCNEFATPTEEYSCPEDGFCPNLMDDVRKMTGFHVIKAENDASNKYVHVADTCQHYFCGIDGTCLQSGGSLTSCMRPVGCLLVEKLATTK